MASRVDTSHHPAYYGTWKIVECVSLAGLVEPTGIEGTVFELDATGDVSWRVAEDAESLPFFSCETYQVMTADYRGEPASLKFIGTYAGHVIEFRAEVSDDLMLLTYDRCCMLQCQKISPTLSSIEHQEHTPYHLLPALHEGFFSDLTVTSDTGKQYHLHTLLLRLTSPNLTDLPSPLNNLPTDVLDAVTHYIYAECLPTTLTETTATNCIKVVGKMTGLEKFCEMCEVFVRNTALKQQMLSLVGDMHGCVDNAIQLFSHSATTTNDLASNPAKLCCVLKNTAREFVIACSHLVTFCDLFSRRKGELSRDERHELIKYTKTRLPVILSQLKTLLSLVKDHTTTLKPSQIHDIASYIVPEIEAAMDLRHLLFTDVRTALEQTISCSMDSVANKHTEKTHKKSYLSDVLGNALRHALHMRELKKLQRFHQKMIKEYCVLTKFEQDFKFQNDRGKVDYIARSITKLIQELPFIVRRLDDFSLVKVSWKDWKYIFKLGTSKVAWGLSKAQSRGAELRLSTEKICSLVQRDVFTKSLKSLRLLDTEGESHSQDTDTMPQEVQCLSVSPSPPTSHTARHLSQLLHSQQHTDMLIEVIEPSDPTDPTIPTPDADPHPTTIRAHCVVVAARCEWFKRALLSGMRESLDKKITVHDASIHLFHLFLQYLYSGVMHLHMLTADQLADMMTLADKFETDPLKAQCEHALCKHLTDDTCLYLMTLADQLNAATLKDEAICYVSIHRHIIAMFDSDEAICYVSTHRHVIDSAMFDSVPTHLKLSIEDRIYWHRLAESEQLAHTDTSTSSSISEVEDLVNNIHISAHSNDASLSSPTSSDDPDPPQDSPRLGACIRELRDVVGDTVPEDSLREVAMAADYDVNRALNYLFSK